ncbi:MAG: RluA family pseudouridine synthase, partial [Cyanobacteria bacterium J06555_13]
MGYLRYAYTAQCPKTGMVWQLLRTEEAECSAIALMRQLAETSTLFHAGNLYGVLLAQTTAGETVVLKGCSGWVPKQNQVPGWVPLLPVPVQMALAEIRTLATLDQLKADLVALEKLPIRVVYEQKFQQYATQLEQLVGRHRERKRERDRARTHYHKTLQGEALTNALKVLTHESQQESTARRRFKQDRDQSLAPLADEIAQADRQMKQLKQHYATLSQTWQQQMQVAYFAERDSLNRGQKPGERRDDILQNTSYQRAGLKLLHYAITHQLMPLSLAEFWWGASEGDYVAGQFYGASDDECQALMCLATEEIPSVSTECTAPLPILYQDEFLIVVDKPAGLLSVPGRRY